MYKILALSLSALLLASCAMHSGDTSGSLTITAPRGALTGPGGTPYTMRYSLRKAGESVLLDNRKYIETTGSDTITIDNIVAGDSYALSLSIGEKTGNNLSVVYYGTTEGFSIAGGTTTDVSLTLAYAPAYTFLTTSGSRASAANVGGTIFVLDGTELKSFTDPATISDRASLVSYGTVNSLSNGKYSYGESASDELWINTSSGIYRYNGESFTSLNAGIAVNVLFSRAAYLNYEVIAVYSGGGASAGMAIAGTETELENAWQTIYDSSDLRDYIADITKDVITGIGVNGYLYYVSTAVGTVIGNSNITSIDDLLAIKNDAANSHWLKAGSEEASIRVVSTAGSFVFAGTNSGVYCGAIDPQTGIPVTPPLALISGTAGLKIVAIDSIAYSSSVFTAAVTDANNVLLFKDEALVQVLDAAVGIPDSATPLFWIYGGEILHLALSGSNGAIDYEPTIN